MDGSNCVKPLPPTEGKKEPIIDIGINIENDIDIGVVIGPIKVGFGIGVRK